MPTSTVENYLKAIHFLSDGLERGALVPVGKVAGHLGLTPGTATTMMKQLVRAGFIDYSPRRGVSLTPEGKSAAVNVLRRHRLIELFLVDVMKLDWSEVHEEAEILEHAFSSRLIERIDEMLGRPEYDPHGDPIPDANGVMPARPLGRLTEAAAGNYRLVRVTREDPETLRWLQERTLVPGSLFELLAHDALSGVLAVLPEGATSRVNLSAALAENLWVSEIK